MANSKNLALSFLQASKNDLEASRLLYKNSLYALSIFHLQQSVEKALKAVLIYTRVAPEKEEELVNWLQKTAGHYVMKNLDKIAEGLMTVSHMKIKVIAKHLTQLLNKSLKQMKAKYCNEIKRIERLDITKYEDVEKLVDWLTKSSSVSTLNQRCSEAYVEIPFLIIKKIPTQLLDFLKQTIIQITRLGVISLSLERFEAVSRYPDVKKQSLGPSLFTKEYPLVRKLDELQNIVQDSINRLSGLIHHSPF